jgi:hypothetical protein
MAARKPARVLLVLTALALAGCARAPSAPASTAARPSSDVGAIAWEKLTRTLPGTWTMSTSTGPFAVRYKLISRQGCQFIVATHAPVLLSYPDAWIYELDERGVRRVEYDETSTVRVTREFLGDRQGSIEELFKDE